MASPSNKFGGQEFGANVDAGRAFKLAQRAEKTLASCVNPEPKVIDPALLLVCPQNRHGATPNIPYVHYGILRSLAKSGFDRHHPQIGICVQAKSPEAKERLIQWNLRFSQGQPLLPPIDGDKALYGTLAGTHLNLALRLIQAGVPSPACDITDLAPAGSSLREVATLGHKWWILPETTPIDQQIEVSLWRNMDQNENQSLHEVEILRNIVQSVAEKSLASNSVALGDLVARAIRRSPAKVSEKALQNLTRYYLRHVEDKDHHLVKELQDYHSARVNPRELVVSANFFLTLAAEKGFHRAPLVRHYLTLANYTRDKARAQAGQADAANFVETSTLVNLAKKTDLVLLYEELLREARERCLPMLRNVVPESVAFLDLADLGILWAQALLAKPLGG